MLFREVCVKPTGLPTCIACQSLPKSAGQAPNYAHFFPACMWSENGAECVFCESFCSKNEKRGRCAASRAKGASHGTPCSPSFTQCVFGKFLPGVTAGHFAEKAPCRRAQGWSRWVLPEAWLVSGGCVGHARFKRRAP